MGGRLIGGGKGAGAGSEESTGVADLLLDVEGAVACAVTCPVVAVVGWCGVRRVGSVGIAAEAPVADVDRRACCSAALRDEAPLEPSACPRTPTDTDRGGEPCPTMAMRSATTETTAAPTAQRPHRRQGRSRAVPVSRRPAFSRLGLTFTAAPQPCLRIKLERVRAFVQGDYRPSARGRWASASPAR
jgi:hypothetical protein